MKHLPARTFNSFTILIAFLDFVCLVSALLLGYWFWVTFPWHGNYQPFYAYSLILWILPPLGVVVFKLVGLYKPEMGVIGVQEQSLIFKAIWILYVVGFAISFFYRGVHFSRLAVFYSVFIAIALVSIERFLARRSFEWLNRRGIGVRQALIYGAGHYGQRLERWIRQSPKLGIRVIGYLDDGIENLVKKPETPAWMGPLKNLKKLAQSKDVSLLFVAHRNLTETKVIEIFQLCRDLDIQCWTIPSLYQFHIERAEMQNIGGIPLVSFRQGFVRRSYELAKRILDIFLAVILLLLTSPLFLIIAVGLRISSPQNSVFFKQTRIGQGGKKFTIYKFRTLKRGHKKDDISPELQKMKKLTTPWGLFLRKSGFDELPQLINVLKGEMSIVGPRPEMMFLVEKYGPLEKERLTVKPGITGLWQISEDRKRLLIHENMDYDLYYVEHFSFNLDLAILIKTFWTVLKRIF